MLQNGVQFDGDQFRMQSVGSFPEAPGMIKWLIKIGFAKTEKQAVGIWIAFIIIAIIAGIYIVTNYGGPDTERAKLIEEQIRMNSEVTPQ